MASTTTSLESPDRLEDVLAHLPNTNTTEYRKRHTIYGPTSSSDRIYLVISGIVGISQVAEDGKEVLLELVRPDELFGESAFLGVPHRSERATAIENVTLMSWAVSEMEELVLKRPRLALALLQILAQRNAEFTRRIESLSRDSIERRLARSLIRFSDRHGTLVADGSLRMMPLSHDLLGQYVGTSREVITHHMNVFRRRGYVKYSRQGIQLYRDHFQAAIIGPAVSTVEESS
jgi:CRP/FNR family transcriptional regulator